MRIVPRKRNSLGRFEYLPAIERFEQQYIPEPNSGCWIWIGTLNHDLPHGYGKFVTDSGKRVFAHRFSYQIFKEPIPDGLVIDHLCKMRCCVNPDHLEITTQAENVRRGDLWKVSGSKTHCPQGHEYTSTNTYTSSGKRYCRECGRKRSLALYYKRKSGQ